MSDHGPMKKTSHHNVDCPGYPRISNTKGVRRQRHACKQRKRLYIVTDIKPSHPFPAVSVWPGPRN